MQAGTHAHTYAHTHDRKVLKHDVVLRDDGLRLLGKELQRLRYEYLYCLLAKQVS
jgi:hypothetical protein